MTTTAPRVCVIGGGIIGLSCAWQLLRSDCAVTLLDPAPGTGATHAAAGMITPASEATFGQEALLRASLASAAAWPGFVTALASDSGHRLDLVRRGTLFVAADHDDEAALNRHAQLLERHQRPVERLAARSSRRLEPALSPRLAGSLLIEEESSVDPRQVVRALLAAITRAGGVVRPAMGRPLMSGDRVVGAVTASGEVHPADVTLLATGWQTPEVAEGLGLTRSIRPLKGQILRLRSASVDPLHRTIRALVHGRFVYLVPRPGDEIVVGATSEDVGPDSSVTAGAVHDLLHDAIEVVPELAEAGVVESVARLRPATADNLPLVGPAGPDGLLVAAGHGRDGILLAPLTAATVTAHVLGHPLPEDAGCFAANRFHDKERS